LLEIEEAGRGLDDEGMFGGKTKVLLFAGRLDAGKNVDNLIDALSRVADQSAFVAFICGDGPASTRLETAGPRVGNCAIGLIVHWLCLESWT